MLVHTVVFWLKESLSDDQKAAFLADLETLKEIDSEGTFIGTPATTDRPVIDRSYDFCLTVLLENMEQHDAYQVHDLHKDFLAKNASQWEKVLIYDAD
ncbi:MAG: Dabb family protein [Lentisphaeria bacterium]|nr:Dabb family protein [Lentisphaeria bacterium]NQZ68599.1 Dabb family protein [Lentisphaeria bacterium]